MKRIAIFASGSGSNAEKIMQYFSKVDNVLVEKVYTNNSKAGVLDRAKKYNIPSLVFKGSDLQNEFSEISNELKNKKYDLIVLAGFLLLIPKWLVSEYSNKIVNIHPSLLPKYGGKGMYGENVHKAVFEAQEKESGITIHYVNEYFDEGKIIEQQKVAIEECKSPKEIAAKVLKIEHEYYPKTIHKILK